MTVKQSCGFFGVRMAITVCPDCDGKGFHDQSGNPSYDPMDETCVSCDSTGTVLRPASKVAEMDVKEGVFEAIHHLRIAVGDPLQREDCAKYALAVLEGLVFEGGGS